jgi:hypothetical protein
MMRRGHNQSTPFGLSAVGCISLSPILVGQSCRFALFAGPMSGEIPTIGQAKNIALLVFVEVWASRQRRPT